MFKYFENKMHIDIRRDTRVICISVIQLQLIKLLGISNFCPSLVYYPRGFMRSSPFKFLKLFK